MRLSEFEKREIKKAFHKIFGDGKIYLFGSRVDDNKRGGDIDLYLSPFEKTEDIYKKKIDFLVTLDLILGEQKIDIVIEQDKNRDIEQVAITTGVEL